MKDQVCEACGSRVYGNTTTSSLEMEGGIVRSSGDVARLCADIVDHPQECCVVLALNAKNRVIDRQVVALGTLASCQIHMRDVFRVLIAVNAAAFIAVHNHPSGDPMPSADDDALTARLVDAGELVGIKLLDHVIVGQRHYSFCDTGRMPHGGNK